MEIFRCGIRNWWIIYFLLQFVWTGAVGNRTHNSDGNTRMLSTRKQKLEELLRVLKRYPESHHMDTEDAPVLIKNETSILAPKKSIEYDLFTPLPKVHPSIAEEDDIHEEAVQIPPPPVNSYEDFYRIFYGSEEGVNHLKRHYGPEGLKRARAQYKAVAKEMEDLKSANEHFLRIRTKARCKTPVPRLIRVKDYYPNPSTIYLPRCTLLHRCGEIAGCCDSDAYQCVPSKVQEVSLYFYKLTVGRNGLGYSKTNKDNIERLVFVNHTSCHCQSINDLPRSRLVDNGPSPLDGYMTSAAEDAVMDDSDTVRSHRRHHHHQQGIPKCRECPVPFNSRTYRDGRCGCDCFDRQKPCLKIKRGKHPLSDVELRCVQSQYCHPPDCEYGHFDVSSGYCPRRHDEAPREVVIRSPVDLTSPYSPKRERNYD